MSNITRHNTRRGNIASKRASRSARAAQFAASERKTYSRAERTALLDATRSQTAAITQDVI